MKVSKYKIKIVCGFRKDQEFTIDANEAHKAYYLFANPDKKVIFRDGLAIKGSDIQRIEPDYISTMGWNPSHTLNDADWLELNQNGVASKLRDIMALAKEVSRSGKKEEMSAPLIELKDKYLELTEQSGSKFAQKVLGINNNLT